jgi:hypothetical protein
VDRPYYSARAGRPAAPAKLPLDEFKRLISTLLSGLIDDGYLQQQLGSHCVDTGYRAGVRGIDLQGELTLTLNKPHLWPFPESIDAWSEDDLFDALEFVHDNVAKPVERHHHSWNNCGWHVTRSDQVLGRQEYRDRANRLLDRYDRGFAMTESGEVVSIPDPGLDMLLTTPIPSQDLPNVVDRVNAAISKFQHHRASLDIQRDAVRDLADVLEFLRPRMKGVITSRDEADLFQIANGFGIRHHRGDQKTSFDPAIWYPWVFQYYLATIHAVLTGC